jgi:hypothetical protein
MDGLTLQAKVYAGYAKAAQRIGLPYDIYRPTSFVEPLGGMKIATIPAAFTQHGAGNFDFSKPSDYAKPMFHALLDGTQVQVGDYLVSENNPQGPFFIAAKDAGVPILAVQTNRTISAFNPGPTLGLGANVYSGTTLANETAIMLNWPASVLLGSRGVRDQQLPEDAGYGSWRVLMPAWPGVVIRPGTILNDDVGNRMIVVSAELQDLGWRIDATQAVT